MHRGMRMEEGSRSSRQHEPGVVAIECVAGGSRAEEWGPGSSEMVQTGDVVEELHIGRGGGAATHAAPFKGGKAGVQKLLHATYKAGETSVEVRVRRPAQHHGSEELAAAVATMQACIVPRVEAGGGAGAMAAVRVGRSRRYVLRSIRDPNYAVGFVDRMESECIAIRGAIDRIEFRDSEGPKSKKRTKLQLWKTLGTKLKKIQNKSLLKGDHVLFTGRPPFPSDLPCSSAASSRARLHRATLQCRLRPASSPPPAGRLPSSGRSPLYRRPPGAAALLRNTGSSRSPAASTTGRTPRCFLWSRTSGPTMSAAFLRPPPSPLPLLHPAPPARSA